MQLGNYHKIRTAVQGNAQRGDAAAIATMEANLLASLRSTGLFHTIDVEATTDVDRLVIAMVGFFPEISDDLVSGKIERLWLDKLGYSFWSAHSTHLERGHIEFQAATRSGSNGHYLTVHLLAQAVAVPTARPTMVVPQTTEPLAPVRWTPKMPALPALPGPLGRPAYAA